MISSLRWGWNKWRLKEAEAKAEAEAEAKAKAEAKVEAEAKAKQNKQLNTQSTDAQDIRLGYSIHAIMPGYLSFYRNLKL